MAILLEAVLADPGPSPSFGQQLRAWRQAAGLSQRTLEERIGKGRNYVYRLEETPPDKQALPERHVCDAIADVLGVQPRSRVWETALVSLGREDIREHYEALRQTELSLTATEAELVQALRDVQEQRFEGEPLARQLISLIRGADALTPKGLRHPSKGSPPDLEQLLAWGDSALGRLHQALAHWEALQAHNGDRARCGKLLTGLHTSAQASALEVGYLASAELTGARGHLVFAHQIRDQLDEARAQHGSVAVQAHTLDHNGARYVVLRHDEAILAAFEVLDSGALQRLHDLPVGLLAAALAETP